MGGVQKQRHTKSRRNKRRSQIKLNSKNFIVCPHCKSAVLPHHVCSVCGYYKDKEIIKIKVAKKKK